MERPNILSRPGASGARLQGTSVPIPEGAFGDFRGMQGLAQGLGDLGGAIQDRVAKKEHVLTQAEAQLYSDRFRTGVAETEHAIKARLGELDPLKQTDDVVDQITTEEQGKLRTRLQEMGKDLPRGYKQFSSSTDINAQMQLSRIGIKDHALTARLTRVRDEAVDSLKVEATSAATSGYNVNGLNGAVMNFNAVYNKIAQSPVARTEEKLALTDKATADMVATLDSEARSGNSEAGAHATRLRESGRISRSEELRIHHGYTTFMASQKPPREKALKSAIQYTDSLATRPSSGEVEAKILTEMRGLTDDADKVSVLKSFVENRGRYEAGVRVTRGFKYNFVESSTLDASKALSAIAQDMSKMMAGAGITGVTDMALAQTSEAIASYKAAERRVHADTIHQIKTQRLSFAERVVPGLSSDMAQYRQLRDAGSPEAAEAFFEDRVAGRWGKWAEEAGLPAEFVEISSSGDRQQVTGLNDEIRNGSFNPSRAKATFDSMSVSRISRLRRANLAGPAAMLATAYFRLKTAEKDNQEFARIAAEDISSAFHFVGGEEGKRLLAAGEAGKNFTTMLGMAMQAEDEASLGPFDVTSGAYAQAPRENSLYQKMVSAIGSESGVEETAKALFVYYRKNGSSLSDSAKKTFSAMNANTVYIKAQGGASNSVRYTEMQIADSVVNDKGMVMFTGFPWNGFDSKKEYADYMSAATDWVGMHFLDEATAQRFQSIGLYPTGFRQLFELDTGVLSGLARSQGAILNEDQEKAVVAARKGLIQSLNEGDLYVNLNGRSEPIFETYKDRQLDILDRKDKVGTAARLLSEAGGIPDPRQGRKALLAYAMQSGAILRKQTDNGDIALYIRTPGKSSPVGGARLGDDSFLPMLDKTGRPVVLRKEHLRAIAAAAEQSDAFMLSRSQGTTAYGSQAGPVYVRPVRKP